LVESKGYRCEPCEDGQIAWEKLDSGEYDISLVLTDIEMPNMNGFDLCRRIKQTPHLMDLPVIALTSLAGSSDIEQGIEVGVDDYQIKMDREKLVASLKNFCDPNAGSSRNKSQPELAGSYA
ncbi:MAG: response regulator, partial [Planctomycetota bacterium]